MNEYFTPCIKPINKICDETQTFWFENPLRFGLWSFLKINLPKEVNNFATCESQDSNPIPLQIVETENEESVRLTDNGTLFDKFGVVVYTPRTNTLFPDNETAIHSIDIVLRVFAPQKVDLTKCDVVDLNIIAMVVKRLVHRFSTYDIWQFENLIDETVQNLKLNGIKSSGGDSDGSFIRPEREFIDITVNYSLTEDLTNL